MQQNYPRSAKIIIAAIFSVNCVFKAGGFNTNKDSFIYILLWTPVGWAPFNTIPMERKAFENCAYKNCFLTGNRSYLKNIIDFDVIMIDVVQIRTTFNGETSMGLPSNRSESQKYCLFSWEPACFYQIPESWNGFFYMSYTYKLTLNGSFPYIVVRDQNDEVIRPKIGMH